MSELHTDDTFMYENCLVGDAAEKNLADLIEGVYDMPVDEWFVNALDEMTRDAEDSGLYDMAFEDAFMDALDKQPQKIEYFNSVWDAVHEKVDEDDPMNTQVGGDHYRQGGIQPIEYIYANNLGFCEANAIKYLTRWKHKDGLKDLEKAKHYIELLIEMEFNNDD